ncbi:phosphotransferase [Kitasatospora sp. NPDC097643]|uniref:phosphotransferase n=1 Tax=Kitasatospora sp. NPDC097643 TaxID=3157230 RepID=UPI003326B460
MNTPATRTDAHPAAARRSPAATALAAVRRYDPLLRNGHLLTASSLLTAGVGAGYWAMAAHLFSPVAVGVGFAAVSAMMFLGGVGQLNLVNTMIRFVPPAGRHTGRLVVRAYLAAAGCTLLLGTGFVLLVPRLAPGLDFLRSPPVAAGFVAATAGYAIFVVQDGVLTGLRRADWVMLENALFAVVKLLLLVLFAAAGARAAILGSWGAGLAFSVLFTNTFVFGWAVPRHARRARAVPDAPAAATGHTPTPGYLAADWTGSLCWLAATTLPPIIVLEELGPASGAYFSVAWLVAYALYQFAINMSASLIVESTGLPAEPAAAPPTGGPPPGAATPRAATPWGAAPWGATPRAADPQQRLLRHCRRVLRHSGALLVAATVLVTATAPWLLRVFGPGYAQEGTTTLRLLALSALPNLVVAVAVAACRVQRRMRVVLTVLTTQAALALGLTAVLLEPLGVAGAGLAWLVAQCTVAAALLVRRSAWLPARATAAGAGTAGAAAHPADPRRTATAPDAAAPTSTAPATAAPATTARQATVRHAAAPNPGAHSDLQAVPGRVRDNPALATLLGLLPIRRPALLYRPVDRLTAHRVARQADPRGGGTARRSTQGRSDVLVFRLDAAPAAIDPSPGPDALTDPGTAARPAALAVKHPRSGPAAATLDCEWDVLRRLEADPRLGEWRRLLPRPVTRRLDGPLPLVTQSWLPGVAADGYLTHHPEHAPRVASAALATLAELHRLTGRTEHPTHRLDDWVESRRALLTAQIRWCRSGPGAEGLAALVARLRRDLTGQPTTVGWFHGDFAPGNVLLSEDGTRVTGVLDWGGARADGPAEVDAFTFVLAMRAHLTGRAWGALATEAVRAGALPPEERELLAAYGYGAGADGIALPLLAWLWHVASNVDKSPRYGRSHWWVGANVVPVLTATARWRSGAAAGLTR